MTTQTKATKIAKQYAEQVVSGNIPGLPLDMGWYQNRIWPPERRHVETGYRDLAFPFTRRPAPSFVMSARWTLVQLLGYFRSWSATAHFNKDKGFDPVSSLELRLRDYRKDIDQRHTVEWPLAILAGSVPS